MLVCVRSGADSTGRDMVTRRHVLAMLHCSEHIEIWQRNQTDLILKNWDSIERSVERGTALNAVLNVALDVSLVHGSVEPGLKWIHLLRT